MKGTAALTALLGATATLVASSALRKHAHTFHARRNELAVSANAAREAQKLETRQNPMQYMNSKTAKYAVNGSALPEVDFDIGETYSGSLPIDDTDKEFFFWFVPTTNPAATNEITIWLNGGPGCSSLDGFFHENGPVIWQPGTYLPVRNTYAWNNLTNIVWVEQPVGTGYSTGTVNATDEVDVATQFRGFWRNFVDLFDLHGRELFVTGESYAGQYVPYIADGMLNQTDTDYFNVTGILIYDPSIGYDAITEQVPTLAWTELNKNDYPLNDTFVSYIQNISKTCGYDDFLAKGLKFPPDGPFAPAPGAFSNGTTTDDCDIFDAVFNAIFEINPCFDIYQVGQLCPIPWDVLGFPYSDFYLPPGFNQPYFNRTDVKEVIHAPVDVNWTICSNNPVFVDNKDLSLPSALTGGPLQRVIEKTNNVIVGHGALDSVLYLNGSLLTLNNLTWNGKQGFTAAPTKPFYVPYHNEPLLASAAGAGVFGSWQEDRGLTFVGISLSGHEVPEFQPSAGFRTLELLLGRISNFSDISPFSTRPGEKGLQSQQPLGMGTAPI
ncbi:MAG: hypothetical protein M1828_000530 [Chrysothrix sp. TS-e1954]|nr:MAG: hypothetical protein M1828_000530 [Chrysothrix sp. TS-e1954]